MFRLEERVQGSGSTAAAHLRQLAKSKKVAADTFTSEHMPVDRPPLELLWLWDLFCDLTRTRTIGMGVNPITFAEMHAWTVLYDMRLEPWEIDTLRQLDSVLVKVTNEREERKRKAAGTMPPTKPPVRRR